MLAATTGPDGVLVESAGWELDALRSAARSRPSRRRTGRCTTPSRSSTTVPAGCSASGSVTGRRWLVARPLALAVEQVRPGTLEGLVTGHPALVEHGERRRGMLAGLPAACCTRPPPRRRVCTATTATAVVRPLDVTGPGSGVHPTSLAGPARPPPAGGRAVRGRGLAAQRHHRGADRHGRDGQVVAHRLPARHRRHDHAAVDPGRRRPRHGHQHPADRRPAGHLPGGHPARRCTRPASARTSRCCSSGTPRAGWRPPRSRPATTGSTSPTSVTAGSPTAQVGRVPRRDARAVARAARRRRTPHRRRAQPGLGRADHGDLRRRTRGRASWPTTTTRSTSPARRPSTRRPTRRSSRASRACTSTGSSARAAR